MKPHHVIITVVIGMSLIAFAPMSKSTEPASTEPVGNPPIDATKSPRAKGIKVIVLPGHGYDGAGLLQPTNKRPIRRLVIEPSDSCTSEARQSDIHTGC